MFRFLLLISFVTVAACAGTPETLPEDFTPDFEF